MTATPARRVAEHPQDLSDSDARKALNGIHAILSGQEWSSDHLEWIADVLVAVGYTIGDPDDEPVCRYCGDPISEDDNGAGGKVWVHDFGSTVCFDDPPGSLEEGDTTTTASPVHETRYGKEAGR